MGSSLPSAPMDRMLSAVLEIVPDAILSGPGQERVLRWASQFPIFALESTFGFESRLDEETAECDMFLSVQPGSRFSRHLIRRGAHTQATAESRGLGRFLAAVTEPESFLSQWFRSVILEYDLVASRAPETEPPGIFIEPQDSLLGAPGSTKPPGHGRGLTCNHGVMSSAICWAVGRAPNEAEHQAMDRVHGALPRGATTEHLGALPGREPRAVRLVLKIPKTEVAPFLERIGWTGSMVQLKRALHWLDRWQSGATTLAVACDVSPGGRIDPPGVRDLPQGPMAARAHPLLGAHDRALRREGLVHAGQGRGAAVLARGRLSRDGERRLPASDRDQSPQARNRRRPGREQGLHGRVPATEVSPKGSNRGTTADAIGAQMRFAIDQGLDFLDAAVSATGVWECHHYALANPIVLLRDTNPFVGALGCLELAGVDDPRAAAILSRTRRHISDTIEFPGVWRYWPDLRPDVDTTSICSLALGFHPWLLAGWNRERLARNRDDSGRLHTWLLNGPIASLDADAIVNANALAYLGETAATRPVRDWLISLVETGSERDAIHYYWDTIDLYAAMARARQIQSPLFEDILSLLATRIRDRREEDGSYGDLARTARALVSLDSLGCPPSRADLAASVHLVLLRQQRDGGWPACPLSSGPLWPEERRFAFVSRCYDTACCIAALDRASAMLDLR